MWHEATKDLQAAGEVQMIGIIQEQHPDRCRLFMQWKGMDWPILVDSLNLLGVSAVPMTFLIDEHGIIQSRARRPDGVAEWVKTPAPEGDPSPTIRDGWAKPTGEDFSERGRAVAEDGGFDAGLNFADDLFLWGGDDHAHHAVMAYERALQQDPDNAIAHFRMGVAQRRKYEVNPGDDADFDRAIEHWRKALDGDPNQYIWRRRIQQYGPRLDKPYSFYDWVHAAREEIADRGESPYALAVEPSGAEFARPARQFESASADEANPDPDGRIDRDEGPLITVETIIVPHTTSTRATARVHVLFRPDEAKKAHWNNEVEELFFRVDPPEGWEVDTRSHTAPNGPGAVSVERREIEFELRRIDDTEAETIVLPAYALYYVCEDVDGECLYRRQDLEITVTFGTDSPD